MNGETEALVVKEPLALCLLALTCEGDVAAFRRKGLCSYMKGTY
jgi:hypothetical protein